MEAAEIAGISGEIQSFPQRFETMVGERGITLSGGQKQRTSLARAILRQPRILILDDSLSSVDTDTEERILRRLRDVMRQRTTILISHRISTVKDADQIIVLREGRIIERGTHEESAGARRLLRRSASEAVARGRIGTRMSDFREEEKLGKIYDTQLTRRLHEVHVAVPLVGVVARLDDVCRCRHGDRGTIPFSYRASITISILAFGIQFRETHAIDGHHVDGRRHISGRCSRALACNTCRSASCNGLGRRRCTICAKRFSSISSACR